MVPRSVGDLPVVCWSSIDQRHRITGNCRHFKLGSECEDPAAAFIAIAGKPGGYYLIRFDKDGTFIADTWHESLEEARHQAEFEYERVSGTWNNVLT